MYDYIVISSFEWDENKNKVNRMKHFVSFEEAQLAFKDEKRIIVRDKEHSQYEKRYFCIGKVKGNIMTVRFVYRDNKIRILGAGYWRKGKIRYEKG